ncbi:hypothetical protein RclHR1_18380001 [Rhizophagus clarus]|uniref:CCHC-type domain-containing protein n=1 Tax=Rhizophagus clarus TaxID=94130 RepID=A0A2Z6QNS3_9GLOM|nr:hypothetical protein RclHR1_18380001 [Rhizophagus clarus]
MVACFFAVIDNCNRTCLVATAFLEDKTEGSFKYFDSCNFEVCWKNLKEKYFSVSSYLNRQLDPLKNKWAVYYINIQFTADANSTQHVKSLNKKVHDSVKCTLSLLTLVREIQQLLDNEANYIRIQEYKNEIPNYIKCYNSTSSISLCSNTSDNEIISGMNNFNLGHITKIRCAELYTLNLQELNNNHIKYRRAHGMMKKAIDLALSTNSYEEFIGIKRRPAGRMKSAVEIQDKESRRNCLRSIDLNILKGGNETQLDNRDNRKTCHNCGQKGHNCATCKFTG